MTTFRTAGRAGALLLPFALIMAACGGAASSSGTPAGDATATPQASIAGTATPGSDASPSEPAISIPSFDIGQLANGLENVDSYRVVMTTDGEEVYKGVVVTKPVLSRDLMVNGTTRIVVIGDEAWMGEDGSALTSVPPTLAAGMFAALDPTLIVGAFAGPEWAQSSVDKGTEQKNGVNAHHYRIDSSTLVGGFAGVPAGASIDIWIADEGYLVAWESAGFGAGGDTTIEVTGIDDPANKVDRPS